MALERINHRGRPWSLKAIVGFVTVIISMGLMCFPLISGLSVVFAYDAFRDIKRMPDLNGKLFAFTTLGLGVPVTLIGAFVWFHLLLERLGWG